MELPTQQWRSKRDDSSNLGQSPFRKFGFIEPPPPTIDPSKNPPEEQCIKEFAAIDIAINSIRNTNCFANGFKTFHFTIDLSVLASENCNDSTFESSCTIDIPIDGNIIFYYWRVLVKKDDQGYHFCLERPLNFFSTWWRSGIPIIYRMALHDNTGSDFPFLCWAGAEVFGKFSNQSQWELVSCTSMNADNVGNLNLHLFISIPMDMTKYCKIQLKPFKVIFDLDDRSPSYVRDQAIVFEKLVLGLEDEKLKIDEDDDPLIDAYELDLAISLLDEDDKPIRVIECHRSIVVLAVPYFRKQFRQRRRSQRSISSQSAINEDNHNRGSIEIHGIDQDAMINILRYAYTKCFPKLRQGDVIDQELAIKIVSAANKLELADLKDYCLAILIFDCATDQDRIEQLKLASKWKVQELIDVCIEQLAWFVFCGGKITDHGLDEFEKSIIEKALLKSWSCIVKNAEALCPETY